MSSVTKLISIYDTVLSASGKVVHNQQVGSNFSPMCQEWFGCDYLEFASDYNDLLDQIKSEITGLKVLKPHKKDEYVTRLEPARRIFAPEMLVARWDQFFPRLSDDNLRTFLTVIEGFFDQDAGLISYGLNKNEILESINNLDEIISKSNLHLENIKICSIYIDNLRNIIKNELSFKDRKILKEYEALIGRSIAMYDCFPKDERKDLTAWIQKGIDFINRVEKIVQGGKKVGGILKDIGLLE